MKTSAALLMGCMVICAAHAQSPANRGRPSFETLDSDRDGRISQDEARANQQVAAEFASADKNGDGHLSRAEFQAQFNRQE